MIQDSYSASHVDRENGTGEILNIQSYGFQDPDKHGAADFIEGDNSDYNALKKGLPGAATAMDKSRQMLQLILDFDCASKKGGQDFTKLNNLIDDIWSVRKHALPNIWFPGGYSNPRFLPNAPTPTLPPGFWNSAIPH